MTGLSHRKSGRSPNGSPPLRNVTSKPLNFNWEKVSDFIYRNSAALFNWMPILFVGFDVYTGLNISNSVPTSGGIIPPDAQPTAQSEYWYIYSVILLIMCWMVRGALLKPFYNVERPKYKVTIVTILYAFGAFCLLCNLSTWQLPVMLTIAFVIVCKVLYGGQDYKDQHIAGTRFTNFFVANWRYRKQIEYEVDKRKIPHKNYVLFAGIPISTRDMPYNVLLIGRPGSGKSVIMILLLQGIHHDCNAIVYDFQKQMRSTLIANGVNEARIIFLNPFELRASQWLLSLDLNTWEKCYEFTGALFPEKPNSKSDDFFRDAPRLVVAVVMMTLNRLARDKGVAAKWELRDLVCICMSRTRTVKIASTYPDLFAKVDFLKEQDETVNSVIMSITTRLVKFEAIAQCWHLAGKAGRNIKLGDFASSNWVLLLGREEVRAKEQIAILNALIIEFVGKVLLDQPKGNETPDVKTWIFLDEVPSIGRISILSQMAVEGRKLGVALVLAFQSYPMMAKLYGKEEVAAISGVTAHKMYLRLDEFETQEWASKNLGQHTVNRPSQSFSIARGSSSSLRQGGSSSKNITNSVSYARVTEPLLIPAEFGTLSFIRSGFLEAVTKVQDLVYYFRIGASDLFSLLPKEDPNLKLENYQPLPEDLGELVDFDEADYDRLHLPFDFDSSSNDDDEDDDDEHPLSFDSI